MIKNKISTVVESQIPSHIREDYPVFVEFIKKYYEFTETSDGALGALYKILHNNDVDSLDKSLLERLKMELAIPLSIAKKDSYVFNKNIKDLYLAKGTEESIRILFRLLFNEEVLISYPKEQILRASDGIWHQESFITVETFLGELEGASVVKIVTESNAYEFEPTKIESIEDEKFRISFSFLYSITIDVGDKVIAYKDGVEIFRGTIVGSPSKIRVIDPGKKWQVGKIIQLPGSISPTIAKILSVGQNGELQSLEILQHGYDHPEGSIFYVSPLKKPLLSSYVTIDSQIASVDPVVYHSDIGISDYIDGFNEKVSIYNTQRTYFLENYADLGYDGELLSEHQEIATESSEDFFNDVTYEEWLQTRTSLFLEFSPIVRTVGYWKEDRGQISNQYIRLQDNLFYQIFSYVIDTNHQSDLIGVAANKTNPSGLKWFVNLNKTNILDLSAIETTRTLSNSRVFLFDVAQIEDSQENQFVLPKSDNVDFSDQDYKIFNLTKTDSQIVTDEDHKIFDLTKTDSYLIDDSQEKQSALHKSSFSVVSDSVAKGAEFLFEDSASTSDSTVFETSKSLSDDANVEDIETGYSLDYFSEAYDVIGGEAVYVMQP